MSVKIETADDLVMWTRMIGGRTNHAFMLPTASVWGKSEALCGQWGTARFVQTPSPYPPLPSMRCPKCQRRLDRMWTKTEKKDAP